MPITLVEAAKQHENPVASGIIEMYARSAPILQVLPFTNINGNALRYNREETLPGVGFRGVNEGYTESVGVLNPMTEPLVIAGGDLDVDKFIVNTMGASQRTIQEMMKVKALALAWQAAFINGDSQSNPRFFDGLQVRVTGDQLIWQTTGAAGAALSLFSLDQLIDLVDEPTHLIMNKAMRRRLTVASRTPAVGGNISSTVDAFGRKISTYNDLPILVMDYDNNGAQVLGFNEASENGTPTVCTSIYCVSIGSGKVTGIQNGAVDVRDLGELQTGPPAYRTRVEWYSGIAVFHGRAIARLAGVTNAVVGV
jgi:hypothetical protein